MSGHFALIGVRADGSRSILSSGLTREEAERTAALLGTAAFSQIVIEAIEPAADETPADEPAE